MTPTEPIKSIGGKMKIFTGQKFCHIWFRLREMCKSCRKCYELVDRT